MFRLRPVDLTPRETSLGLIPAHETIVREVSIEQRHTESFVMNPSAEPIEAERRESLLVVDFCAYMKSWRDEMPKRH